MDLSIYKRTTYTFIHVHTGYSQGDAQPWLFLIIQHMMLLSVDTAGQIGFYFISLYGRRHTKKYTCV